MAKIDTSVSEIKMLGGIELSEYYKRELQNNESELFVIEDKLYKIIDAMCRRQKQQIMEFVHDEKHEIPIDIIDLMYEKEKFFGYVMKLYDDYEELYTFLKSNASLNDRKKIALEIVKIYENMLKLKIVYFDWHSKNLMIKNDLKLLDIDSAKRNANVVYDALSRRNMLNLCISLILGVDLDFDYDISERSKNELFEKIVGEEKMALSRIEPLSLDFIREEINSYTINKVDCEKEMILKL